MFGSTDQETIGDAFAEKILMEKFFYNLKSAYSELQSCVKNDGKLTKLTKWFECTIGARLSQEAYNLLTYYLLMMLLVFLTQSDDYRLLLIVLLI